MPSFPEFNPIFDNAQQFIKPPSEHPYWANNIFALQEFGFSREYLVSLAELDKDQDGRLAARMRRAASFVERICTPVEGELALTTKEVMLYEPQYVANALMRPLGNFWGGSDEWLKGASNLMQHLIETDEVDDFEFGVVLFQAYHPNNRLMMAFRPGVRPDGTIIDAAGSFSQHPQMVDERGRLFDLTIILPRIEDGLCG